MFSKEEGYEKDFEQYSQNEKKYFFKMLKYNCWKKSSEENKENGGNQELPQKFVSKTNTLEKSKKSSKLISVSSENKQRFKMESEEDQEKNANFIMELNNKILREVLERKWVKFEKYDRRFEEIELY